MSSEVSGWLTVSSVSNGYTIEVTRYAGQEFLLRENYIARSWAEVIDILKNIPAPDYAEAEGGES